MATRNKEAPEKKKAAQKKRGAKQYAYPTDKPQSITEVPVILQEVKEKRGPKGIFPEWTSPAGLGIITGWKRRGLYDFQIAEKIGIRPATLVEWKKRSPELAQALKNSKEIALLAVENAMFNNAIRGNFLSQICILKNWDPEHWRDNPQAEALESAKLMLEQKRAEVELKRLEVELAKLKLQYDDHKDVPNVLDTSGLTDDELRLLMKIAEKQNGGAISADGDIT